MWISPPVTSSVTLGTENLEVWFNAMPTLPENDDDPLEIPHDGYMNALVKCGMWKSRFLQGIYNHIEIAGMENDYRNSAREVMGDSKQSSPQKTVSAWENRQSGRRKRRWGERDQGPSGGRYTLPD